MAHRYGCMATNLKDGRLYLPSCSKCLPLDAWEWALASFRRRCTAGLSEKSATRSLMGPPKARTSATHFAAHATARSRRLVVVTRTSGPVCVRESCDVRHRENCGRRARGLRRNGRVVAAGTEAAAVLSVLVAADAAPARGS